MLRLLHFVLSWLSPYGSASYILSLCPSDSFLHYPATLLLFSLTCLFQPLPYIDSYNTNAFYIQIGA